MTSIARALDLGLELMDHALPRRGRVALVGSLLMLVMFWMWPELLLEIAHLRSQPIMDAVLESVQGLGSGPQEQ